MGRWGEVRKRGGDGGRWEMGEIGRMEGEVRKRMISGVLWWSCVIVIARRRREG